MSLKNFKKQELKDMLEKLNLDASGFKPELEDRLSNYLDSKKLALEDIPELAEHFDSPASPSTARKARKSIAHATYDPD